MRKLARRQRKIGDDDNQRRENEEQTNLPCHDDICPQLFFLWHISHKSILIPIRRAGIFSGKARRGLSYDDNYNREL